MGRTEKEPPRRSRVCVCVFFQTPNGRGTERKGAAAAPNPSHLPRQTAPGGAAAGAQSLRQPPPGPGPPRLLRPAEARRPLSPAPPHRRRRLPPPPGPAAAALPPLGERAAVTGSNGAGSRPRLAAAGRRCQAGPEAQPQRRAGPAAAGGPPRTGPRHLPAPGRGEEPPPPAPLGIYWGFFLPKWASRVY